MIWFISFTSDVIATIPVWMMILGGAAGGYRFGEYARRKVR